MPKGVPNKRYTPEFKRMVVETMEKEHLSIYAAMQEFGINDHKIIERWERIYLEDGPEGLSVERRGRSSTGRSKKLPKEVEEDLLAEVQRLRAENDYKVNLKTEIMIEDLYDKVNAILARQTALEKQLTEEDGESAGKNEGGQSRPPSFFAVFAQRGILLRKPARFC